MQTISLADSCTFTLHLNLTLVIQRSNSHTFQTFLGHPFQPHRLPDTCTVGIPDTSGVPIPELLSSRNQFISMRIIYPNCNFLFSLCQIRSHIYSKRCIASCMLPCLLAIYIHHCFVVNCLKMKEKLLSFFWLFHRKSLFIPDNIMRCLVIDSTKLTLIDKRNLNLSVQMFPSLIPFFFDSPVCIIKSKLPGAIEILPL